MADTCGGHYMDQFTYAERATDWRGNNNIAESMFTQMALEDPSGAVDRLRCRNRRDSATIGRYVRYRRLATRICLSDPECSVFHRRLAGEQAPLAVGPGSLIEGIGRPRVEQSFIPELIDRWQAVPDAASVAAARFVSQALGRPCGGSTGTNFWVAAGLVAEMAAAGTSGSIVALLCDSGIRYGGTYFNDQWVKSQGLDLEPHLLRLKNFMTTGRF